MGYFTSKIRTALTHCLITSRSKQTASSKGKLHFTLRNVYRIVRDTMVFLEQLTQPNIFGDTKSLFGIGAIT